MFDDLRLRLMNYFELGMIVFLAGSFFWKAVLPSWLGGRKRPEGISARDFAFGEFYSALGPEFAEFEETTVVPALVASAYGTVLELGPGTGNQLPRFDKNKVDRIYGVESNPAFAAPLAAKIKEAGLEDIYTPIIGSIDDGKLLAASDISDGKFDCIVSMQVLCSVKSPEKVASLLYRLLKPGGSLIFWEHRRSNDFVTRTIQALYNPFWTLVIGGCKLTHPLKEVLINAGEWREIDIEDDEVPSSVLPRTQGKLVKA